jgi:hypothetical protein
VLGAETIGQDAEQQPAAEAGESGKAVDVTAVNGAMPQTMA